MIGIFDWGIGGLGFYRLLRAERPDLDVLYLGDQGVLGYGMLGRSALARRVCEVLKEFRDQGVTDVVVACNAASTILDEVAVPGVRVTGMIRPTLDALASMPVKTAGVIGGRRTIRSGAYAREMRARGIAVRQRVAQPLSRRIEDGQAFAGETLELLTDIVRPLRGVDVLVNACTHYVVLESEIRNRLPGTRVLDPATEAWRRVRVLLPDRGDPPQSPAVGSTRFVTTGDPAHMTRQAMAAFGIEAVVERISI